MIDMTDKTVYENLVKEFIDTIWNQNMVVDPNDDYHWKDLIYGWALARGLKPYVEPYDIRSGQRSDLTEEEKHAYDISANRFASDVYYNRT